MLTIANNTARDSMYGMAYRVSVGAALSMIDAATDFYTISTYNQSQNLVGQANALLAMIVINLIFQISIGLAVYQKKGDLVKIKETLICLFFLRPIVDAFRVSTNQEDGELVLDSTNYMIANKVIELVTESIPACVFQLYVWLARPNEAGTYALVSIGVCALTTGFTSVLIAFDYDTDEVS